MFITGVFCLLLVAVMLAWLGKRDRAMLVFAVSFLAAFVIFIHDLTDVIGLSL